MSGLTVADIAARPRLRETLASFDFIVGGVDEGDPWFRVEAAESFSTVATDGSGGVFLTGVDSGSILYVSSEGEAGVVAASVGELLQLIVAHPGWMDILKLSGGGELSEMRRAALVLELNTESFDREEPDTLRDELALPPPAHPVGLLYTSASRKDVRVYAPDGREFDALFHSFTADDLG